MSRTELVDKNGEEINDGDGFRWTIYPYQSIHCKVRGGMIHFPDGEPMKVADFVWQYDREMVEKI